MRTELMQSLHHHIAFKFYFFIFFKFNKDLNCSHQFFIDKFKLIICKFNINLNFSK